MFTLSTSTYIKLGLAAAVAAAGYLGYRHYEGLVDAKADLTAKNAILQDDVSREKARADAYKSAIDKWDEAADKQAQALADFSKAQREASRFQRELKDVLSQHDLGALAKRKPGLVENRINTGTERAMRLLESATGARSDSGATEAASPGGSP